MQDAADKLCLVKEDIDNGYCINFSDQKICYCVPGYTGDLCQECQGKLVNGQCYKSDFTGNGDCYVNIRNP